MRKNYRATAAARLIIQREFPSAIIKDFDKINGNSIDTYIKNILKRKIEIQIFLIYLLRIEGSRGRFLSRRV